MVALMPSYRLSKQRFNFVGDRANESRARGQHSDYRTAIAFGQNVLSQSYQSSNFPLVLRHVFLSERTELEESLIFCYLQQLNHECNDVEQPSGVDTKFIPGAGDDCMLGAMKKLLATSSQYRVEVALRFLLDYGEPLFHRGKCSHCRSGCTEEGHLGFDKTKATPSYRKSNCNCFCHQGNNVIEPASTCSLMLLVGQSREW